MLPSGEFCANHGCEVMFVHERARTFKTKRRGGACEAHDAAGGVKVFDNKGVVRARGGEEG